jgi:hypothetical protein
MPVFLLSLLGVGKSAVNYGLQWLSRRSLAQIACIALALACLFLFVANRAEKRHSAKVEAQLAKAISTAETYKRELYAISNKRNEQQVVTRDRIVEVTRTIKSADERAKVVETAPPPGECRTAKEVLDADV